MKIVFKDKGIISDNDASYFGLLEGVIDSVDYLASMTVTRKPSGFHFRLIPSGSVHINHIIEQINHLNNIIGLRAEYSKSVKSSSVINFTLNQ